MPVMVDHHHPHHHPHLLQRMKRKVYVRIDPPKNWHMSPLTVVLAILCAMTLFQMFGFISMHSNLHGTMQGKMDEDFLSLKSLFLSYQDKMPKVSVVILTFKSYERFSLLLRSVLEQEFDEFELIIADAGCIPETQQIIDLAFLNKKKRLAPHKYIQLCHNPGYAVANNEAVKLAHPSSEYVLFLNDDIIITKPFISNLVKLAETKRQTAGAVGCSLRAIAGDKMQEAGSIVWKDGSAAAFGRNSENLDAPEFNYPRPVDYVSGACLMVRKDVFVTYGGFDGKNFPNYYEDTDLQLHIQHDLHKEVWLAPRAVAVHDEHGSFGADEAVNKMQAAQKLFYEKWKSSLIPKHVENPHRLPEEEKNIEILKASDLRARDPSKARILYLDAELPNPAKGGGFGRSFDNLSMIVELGHRVTVASYTKTSDQWCDWFCRERIQELGIEVYTGAWEEMVLERIGFYQIVIISRPTIFRLTHLFFRNMMQKSPFSVIYDSEALWYRRDADLLRLYKGGIDFPSMENEQITIEEKELITKIDQSNEIKLLGLADVVITVSNGEKAIASELNPKASIETIGHIMSEENEAKSRTGFRERAGILFVASFDDKMYYNGDAIWYFLKEIYPSVLERSPSIKLTVAGRNIPQYLRTFVKVQGLDRDVTFMESPEDLHQLFDSHRVFIAPHLYGSGIQFKLSEAMSFGIPCVMSKLSADAFGIERENEISCIGEDPESFGSCVISLHQNEKEWNTVQENGRNFIKQTHSRHRVMSIWSEVIEEAKAKFEDMKSSNRNGRVSSKEISHSRLFSTDLWVPTESCPEGEALYMKLYPDVSGAVDQKMFQSAFQHWRDHGHHEGRSYVCQNFEGV